MRRFKATYGVDIEDEKNFDYVIDTTASSSQEVANLIETLATTQNPGLRATHHWFSTKNLFPTERLNNQSAQEIVAENKKIMLASGYNLSFGRIEVIRSGHDYLIDDGHKRTSAAILAGLSHIPVNITEGDEKLPSGQTGCDYVKSTLSFFTLFPCKNPIYDWEANHDFRFTHYPTAPLTTPTSGQNPRVIDQCKM